VSALEVAERLEKAQRREWFHGAARVHYGRCETCQRTRDMDDRPLLVARQPYRRKFECFHCHLGLSVALPPEPEIPLPADVERRGG